MGISEGQRLRRRQRLGSSDSPPVVGIPIPTAKGEVTAYDVFLDKTEDLAELRENEAIEIGNDFEEPLLRWASRELGEELQVNVEVVPTFDIVLAANLDARLARKRQAVEAKTGMGADYGEPGTDQIPDRVIVQCQHQMYCAELDLVWVPVLVAKFDRLHREMYKVTRNEALIQLIVERDHEFWENHVLPRIPPSNLLPSLGVLQRVRRIPNSLADVSPELVEAWRMAREERLAAEKRELTAQCSLIASLGGAEGAEFGDPRKVLVYRGYSYERMDEKRLKREAPETWKQWARTIDVSPSLKEVNR